ncbi:ParA family protein [Gluconobacter kondonii]|nr:ParA family protein [Gluconobacter kondonii]MBS1058074.1 ParA family protein [Gluconobacter kondonii]
MPVIVMASPKGGVGKSTCAVLLATEFARMNAEVTVLDCDPNHSLTRWASRSIPSGIRLVSDVGRSEIVQTIKRVTPSQRFLSILPCCHPLNRYELPILDFQVFFRFVIYFR